MCHNRGISEILYQNDIKYSTTASTTYHKPLNMRGWAETRFVIAVVDITMINIIHFIKSLHMMYKGLIAENENTMLFFACQNDIRQYKRTFNMFKGLFFAWDMLCCHMLNPDRCQILKFKVDTGPAAQQ